MAAAGFGKASLVGQVLALGADVDALSHDSRSAIWYAAVYGEAQVRRRGGVGDDGEDGEDDDDGDHGDGRL
jgi:hypothetical protein